MRRRSTIRISVCEYPDDFLASVLQDRPLGPEEAKEVLRACVSALAYLHGHGFVHGAVDTAHVMAFGDTVKLPSDTIARDGSPAADMWSLGGLLHEILTQKAPDLDED